MSKTGKPMDTSYKIVIGCIVVVMIVALISIVVLLINNPQLGIQFGGDDENESYTVTMKGDEYGLKVVSVYNGLKRDGQSAFDKYKLAHDFVVQYLEYDAGSMTSMSGYEQGKDKDRAMWDRIGGSKAYALMYQDICNEMGLKCSIVEGDRYEYVQNTSKKGYRWYWNTVEIDNQKYFVDTCTDDREGNYKCFLQGGGTWLDHGFIYDDDEYKICTDSYNMRRGSLKKADITIIN